MKIGMDFIDKLVGRMKFERPNKPIISSNQAEGYKKLINSLQQRIVMNKSVDRFPRYHEILNGDGVYPLYDENNKDKRKEYKKL